MVHYNYLYKAIEKYGHHDERTVTIAILEHAGKQQAAADLWKTLTEIDKQ